MRCSHRFVFDGSVTYGGSARDLNKITDFLFQSAIRQVSANDRLFFTFDQLLYSLNKKLVPPIVLPSFITYVPRVFSAERFVRPTPRQNKQRVTVVVITVILWSLLLSLRLSAALLFVGFAGSVAVAVLLSVYFKRLAERNQARRLAELLRKQQQFESDEEWRRRNAERQNEQAQQARDRFRKGQRSQAKVLTEDRLRDWLRQWQTVNGPIQKLLVAANAAQTVPLSPSPDVTAYSFDRLVVCQLDDVAQMLIANQFHFENNCAVVSVNGYPQPIFDTIMQMVRRNPDLQVYALHNCTSPGMHLLHQLQTDDRWFPDRQVTIVDAGLRPQQVIQATRTGQDRQMRLFIEQSFQSAELAQQLIAEGDLSASTLSEEETEWLRLGYFVMLESFTPQKLIQVLSRSMAAGQQLNTETSTLVLLEAGDTDFYAGEGFG